MKERWIWLGWGVLGGSLGLLAAAALLATSVLAEDAAPAATPVPPPASPKFSVALSQQDLPNVREICMLAQKSPALTLEQATGVGTFCVDFLRRLGAGLSASPPAAPNGEKEQAK